MGTHWLPVSSVVKYAGYSGCRDTPQLEENGNKRGKECLHYENILTSQTPDRSGIPLGPQSLPWAPLTAHACENQMAAMSVVGFTAVYRSGRWVLFWLLLVSKWSQCWKEVNSWGGGVAFKFKQSGSSVTLSCASFLGKEVKFYKRAVFLKILPESGFLEALWRLHGCWAQSRCWAG